MTRIGDLTSRPTLPVDVAAPTPAPSVSPTPPSATPAAPLPGPAGADAKTRALVDPHGEPAVHHEQRPPAAAGGFTPLGMRLHGAAKVGESKASGPRRVGVFLGSFNPPHAGHKATVDRMKAAFGLDVVYVVPDRSAAYKKLEDLSLRQEMVQALFAGQDDIKLLTPEMAAASSSGEMWDVLRAVRDEHPSAAVLNIVGSDTLRWWVTLPAETRQLAGPIELLVNDRHDGDPLPSAVDGRPVHLVQDLDAGLSSTQMRAAIAEGRQPDALPDGVWSVVRRQGLYGLPK